MEGIMRNQKDSFCFSSQQSSLNPPESWRCINIEMKNILERKEKKKPSYFRFSQRFASGSKCFNKKKIITQKMASLNKQAPSIFFKDYVFKKQNHKNYKKYNYRKDCLNFNINKKISKEPMKLNKIQIFEIKKGQILEKRKNQIISVELNKSHYTSHRSRYQVKNKQNKIRLMRQSMGQLQSNYQHVK